MEGSWGSLGGLLKHFEVIFEAFGVHFRASKAFSKRFAEILKNLQIHNRVLQNQGSGDSKIEQFGLNLDSSWGLGAKRELIFGIRAPNLGIQAQICGFRFQVEGFRLQKEPHTKRRGR